MKRDRKDLIVNINCVMVMVTVLVLVALPLFGRGVLRGGEAWADTKTINFAWEQAVADMPNLKEWRVKSSQIPGGPYTLLATISYSGTVLPSYTGSGTVTVAAGLKRTIYFVVTAVGKSGAESAVSNEISDVIDFTTVTVPIQFRIVIGN